MQEEWQDQRFAQFQLELQLREQERIRSLLRVAVGKAERAVRRSYEVRRESDSTRPRRPTR